MITNPYTGAHLVFFGYQVYGDQYTAMLEVEGGGSLKTSRSYHYLMSAASNYNRIMIASQIKDCDRVFLLYEDRNAAYKFILVKVDYRFMKAFKE